MKTILLLMLSLVPVKAQEKYQGEPAAEARARYEVIARAIKDEVKGDMRLAKFLLTVGKHESSFSRKIHSGKKKGDGGRSWGLFQIMCGRYPVSKVPATKYQARDIVGVDYKSTRAAVDAAAGYLRFGIRKCKGDPACVFRRYGGISKTHNPKIKKLIDARVRTYRKL